MGLDELRARLDSLLANHGIASDRRAEASGLHAALVDFKVALGQSRDALAGAERELAGERQHLANAERRGRLAGEIGDAETVRVAEEFRVKHAERVALLERKVGVIRDELAYTEREYETLSVRFQASRQGLGTSEATPTPHLSDHEFDALKAKADREASEQAVKAQLDLLKKKLGKE
jgi:hypothetical protein